MKRQNSESNQPDAKRQRRRLLCMQISDLADELQITDAQRLAAQKLVETIRTAIDNADIDNETHKLDDLEWFKEANVTFPLTLPFNLSLSTVKSSCDVRWIKPQAIEVLSNPSIGYAMKEEASLDLNVIIPRAYFGSRDYLNFAYFVKRAHYLCRVAYILKNAGLTVEYSLDNYDTLKPLLIITKRCPLRENNCARIFFSPSREFTKLSRLRPENNNLRPSFCRPSWSAIGDKIPTPIYNSKIAFDVLRSEMETNFSNFFAGKPNFSKAYIVIKCWMRHRGFNARPDGFCDPLLKAWFMFLHDKGNLGDQTIVVDIISAFFSSLVLTNWKEFSYSLKANIDEATILQFKKHYEFVFLDFTGFLNLSASLSTLTVNHMRAAASDTLKKLDYFDEFDSIFVVQHHFTHSFDYFIRIRLTSDYVKNHLAKMYPAECVDACSDQSKVFIRHLTTLLEEAWHERVLFFDCTLPNIPFSQKEINELFIPKDYERSDINVLIGARLTGQWTRSVLRGPPAKSSEGKHFRDFWGDRSELRRFADNAICEAVVWSSSTFSAHVPFLMCKHIVERHLNIDPSCVEGRSLSDTDLVADTTKRYEAIARTFNKLCTSLRKLDNLPLAIATIQPVSSYLRRTSPQAPPSTHTVTDKKHAKVRNNMIAMPTPHLSPQFCPTVEVHLIMEQSGKWGEDLATIAHLKTAFYLELSKVLNEKDGIKTIPFNEYLIVHLDSVLFRLAIAYPKEVNIMRKINGGATGIPKDSASSKNKEMEVILKPQLAILLHSMSQKFPAFAETCRLLSYWLSSFMLSDYIDDLILETIAASVFVKPLSIEPPQTAYVALLHCLTLIANHNWLLKPLFVDFNNDWTDDDIDQMEKEFIKMRPVLPAMVICTCVDQSGSRWTRHEPQPLVLKRIISLAAVSSTSLSQHITGIPPINIKSLFTPDLTSLYDVTIRIRGRHMVRVKTASGEAVDDCLPVFDYDPVGNYLQRLRNNFRTVALFFCNKYACNKIGVLWKPMAKEAKNATISSCLHRSMQADGSLLLNQAAILEDFAIIGKGIVRDVFTKMCRIDDDKLTDEIAE